MAVGTPFALIILDGWGVKDDDPGNAIARAKPEHLARYAREFPSAALAASGIDVGLMWGVPGNSETGHLNIGSGRVVYQQLPRILFAIQDGSFARNPALQKAVAWVKERGSTLHLAGLFSSGTVHSFVDILYGLLELVRSSAVPRVALHLWLDGRDCYIREAATSIVNLNERLRASHLGKIASLMGRSFSMDRNGNWDLTRRAYDCMVQGAGRKVTDLNAYLEANYNLGLTDEFIEPAVVVDENGNPVGPVRPGDAVILFNFRADRMRQIVESFVSPRFSKFPREKLSDVHVVTLGDCETDLPVATAFPTEDIRDTLTETLSRKHLRQLHIAETEKYAHVTYFLNGRREAPFPGEERVIIPSQHHADFDAHPEMRAPEIASRVIDALERNAYDCYVVNFANADMVGHTGNIPAAIQAVQAVDRAVGAIVEVVLARHGTVIITGDHGNAEEMIRPKTGQPLREHSKNAVPLHLIGESFRRRGPQNGAPHVIGRLADIAPTALDILHLPPPKAMTGKSLLPELISDNSIPGKPH